MNKRQISVIRHILTVIVVTLVFIFALINLRDAVNRSERIREMGELAKAISRYRQQNGSLPPESWVSPIVADFARLGDLEYRARYILYDSPGDTILAYTRQKSYAMFVKSGYVYLQLDGQVKWLPPDEFEHLLKQQEGDRSLQLYKMYGEESD